ncbi:unnamed protein product [Symbiodinium sp. KB8]|nr:unnamed protein product [Symbiodinium sp. KB8]
MGSTSLTGLFNHGTEALTGPASDPYRRLRDESPYGTRNYGTEALTGRRRLGEPLTGLFNYGTEAEGLTGRASFRDGGAYGTSLLMGLLIARRRDLRDEPPFRDGGAYGTSFLRDGGSEALTGRTAYGTLNNGSEGLTGGAYETTLLTGLVLRDDRTEELTGRASLWDF